MTGFPLLAALFATAAAAQAPAQPAPAASQAQNDIIVRGERQDDERIRDVVGALTDVPNLGQIGRFHSPVCPAVTGLPDVQGRLIAERMRRVAQAATIRVGGEKCTPNVFLIIASDKRVLIHQLYDQFPAYFTGMSSRQVRSLAAAAQPAVAWQVKGRLNADGEALEKPAGADYHVVEGTHDPSRLRLSSMPHFVASIVVAELNSVGGLSVTQLADYAAMRAFADTNPRRAAGSGAPTILTILDAADNQPVPVTLTQWDLGYLKSLYATSNARYATQQRGEMAQELKKELAKSGELGN